MVPRRRKGNPKRRLSNGPDHVRLEAVREQVRYRGSPLHKRSPGDYGLTPPSDPRPNKTLCDGVSVFQREVAQELLEQGIGRGWLARTVRMIFPATYGRSRKTVSWWKHGAMTSNAASIMVIRWMQQTR